MSFGFNSSENPRHVLKIPCPKLRESSDVIGIELVTGDQLGINWYRVARCFCRKIQWHRKSMPWSKFPNEVQNAFRSPCWLMSSLGDQKKFGDHEWRESMWNNEKLRRRHVWLLLRDGGKQVGLVHKDKTDCSAWQPALGGLKELCPFWRSDVHSYCSEFATSSHWSICDDCCICPQMTWQFMFLDNTFKSKKSGIFGTQKPSTPHHLNRRWVSFFAAGIRSTGVEIQIRRVDEHSSQLTGQLWAERGGFGQLPLQWRTWGGFIFRDPKSHHVILFGQGRQIGEHFEKIGLTCGTRKWTKSACHGQQPLHRTPARLLSRCAFCVPLASTHWNIIGSKSQVAVSQRYTIPP